MVGKGGARGTGRRAAQESQRTGATAGTAPPSPGGSVHLPELDAEAEAVAEQHRVRGVVVEEVKEDDDLAAGPDEDRPGAEPLHALVVAPEPYVALERQEVKDSVKERHRNRKALPAQRFSLRMLQVFRVHFIRVPEPLRPELQGGCDSSAPHEASGEHATTLIGKMAT